MAVQVENYVVNKKGKPVAVLVPMRRYRKFLEAMEELQDVQAYDRAKDRKDDLLPLNEAFKLIEQRRK
ncbi:MAG: type II toxin-antitoxin system prevent-host-death family antitoxin [Phycisphaerae bacterium]